MRKFNDQIYNDAQFRHRPKTVYHAYAQAVWELFQPKSVLDLGCANGYALDWWQKQGIKVSGVEPAKAAYQFMPPSVKAKIRQLDLRRRLKLTTSDLVNFTEVAEHIEAKYEPVMLKNVVSAVKNFLVISWSNEVYQDQPTEHVNPRPAFYVKIRLRRLGLFFEPELTRQLKTKLQQPVFKNWSWWSKYVLVFSRTPQAKRVLIRHYEWLPSYANKNIGYFADTCSKNGFAPRWGNSLLGRWHRVWMYPFEKHLLLKLLMLKLFGNKTILKLDSAVFPAWRAQLVKLLADKVLVESAAVARPFGISRKLIYFSGGISKKNLNLIRSLKIKREKVILYAGRQIHQKGFDRLKKIIPRGWKLKIATDLPAQDYYREVLTSSIVVLPTRGEGWPNVFQDAFYCQRLFLTTTGAKCGQAIIDKTFHCGNSIAGLKLALKKITGNIEAYYRRFDQLYDPKFFQLTDPVFSKLLKKAD